MPRRATAKLTRFGFQVLFDPPKSLWTEARDNAIPIGKGGRRCKTSRKNETAESPNTVAMCKHILAPGSTQMPLVHGSGSVVPINRWTPKPIKLYHEGHGRNGTWMWNGSWQVSMLKELVSARFLQFPAYKTPWKNETNIYIYILYIVTNISYIANNCSETKFPRCETSPALGSLISSTNPVQVMLPKWLCFDKRHQAKVASRLDWTPQPFVPEKCQFNSSCCIQIAKAQMFFPFLHFPWLSSVLLWFLEYLFSFFNFAKILCLLSGFDPLSIGFLRWSLGVSYISQFSSISLLHDLRRPFILLHIMAFWCLWLYVSRIQSPHHLVLWSCCVRNAL